MSVFVVWRSGESFFGESRKLFVCDFMCGIFNVGRCDEFIDCFLFWNDEFLFLFVCFCKLLNCVFCLFEVLDGFCVSGLRVSFSVEVGLGLVGDLSKCELMFVNFWDYDFVCIKDLFGFVVRFFEEECLKFFKFKFANDGCFRCDFDFVFCDDFLVKFLVLVVFFIIGCVIFSLIFMRVFIFVVEIDGVVLVVRSSSICKICVYNLFFGFLVVCFCI